MYHICGTLSLNFNLLAINATNCMTEPSPLLREETSAEPPLLRSVPSAGSFTRLPVTPMTPHSPGSPSAFFYHTATANIVVLAPPSPSDSNVSSAATTGAAAPARPSGDGCA